MERRSFRGIKQWRGGASGELKNGEEELQGNKTVEGRSFRGIKKMERRSFRGIKQWRGGASGELKKWRGGASGK